MRWAFLALACAAGLIPAPGWCAPAFPVPSTISPAAAAALTRLMAMPKLGAGAAPHTAADWQNRFLAGEKMSSVFLAPIVARLHPATDAQTLGGVPTLRVVPAGAHAPSPRVLIYVHGGAYTMLSARSSLATAAEMAAASGLTVYSVDYTLAPRGNWRTATDQVIAVYRALLAQHHPARAIGLFGDSAGGGLVAGSVLKMRDEGVALPGALVLLSPWSDITANGDTYATLAAADPMLNVADLRASADAYAAPADQLNPYVSPVYGDYAKGFPPTLIQGGTREIFLSNFVRQYRAIDQGGGQAVLDLYEGMPHVFQSVLPDTPESQTALAKAASFWRQHLAQH